MGVVPMKKLIIFIVFMAVLLTLSSNAYAEDKIKIEVGDYTLTATLSDNSSAKAFVQLLSKGKLTVEMSDYGDFEKVGSLGTTLPRNDTYITTEPGDLILYQGNNITIYYDVNSWTFTKLGKIDGISSSELRDILGKGDITAVFSLPEENNFSYGDADCNGSLTANDAALVLKKILNANYKLPIEDKTNDYLKYMDVDGDSNISATDCAHILQKVLMGTYLFPCEK